MRARDCTPDVARGRLRKAVGFMEAARDIDVLDDEMKTKAGYSHKQATADELKRATRAANQLVDEARSLTAQEHLWPE